MSLQGAAEDDGDEGLVELHGADGEPRCGDGRVLGAGDAAQGGGGIQAHVEREDDARVLDGGPEGLPLGVPDGRVGVEVGPLGALEAELGDVLDLCHGSFDVVAGDAAEADVAVRLGGAEIGDVVVVGVECRSQGVAVLEGAGEGEDAVDDLGVNVIPLLVLEPRDGVGGATVLGDEACGAHGLHSHAGGFAPLPVDAPRADAVLALAAAYPNGPVVTIDDAGHASLPLGGDPGGEGVRGDVGHVHV